VRARTQAEVDRLRAGVRRVGELSDNVVKLGPFGIGIGGLLAWIPVAGPIYSFLAGTYLLLAGFRARVPWTVLATALFALSARTLAEAFADVLPPPFAAAPDIAVDLFRAHKWAADRIGRAIDETHYLEGGPPLSRSEAAQLCARSGKRRLMRLD
jgi:hypothetical protein